ncbi:hypothetical protein SKAU_G00088220 [Synaphobranchus kaupii]|uniref:Interleukin-12 subunit alpha n=1 Tax=Synaphobranchus kaupii TaxID=118154 RepID=A0A9Q1J5V8_SYNKA|nr:hypothetical protein SKAU_G00088220 [Synaphobranchus kaupii]
MKECVEFSRILLNVSYNLTRADNVCLGNIKVDLEYHRNKLLAYKKPLLDSSVVEAINNLLKNCNFPSAPQDSRDSTLTTPISPQSLKEFERRQQLCRELKGFHVRTITINRIMGYIAVQKEEKEN